MTLNPQLLLKLNRQVKGLRDCGPDSNVKVYASLADLKIGKVKRILPPEGKVIHKICGADRVKHMVHRNARRQKDKERK